MQAARIECRSTEDSADDLCGAALPALDRSDPQYRRDTTAEGLPRRPVTAIFGQVWIWVTALLAITSAATQLLVSGHNSRLVLLAITELAALLLCFNFGRYLYNPRIGQLQAVIRRQDRQIKQYRTAVDRLIDRQVVQFKERVEITVTLGADPTDDRIDERHIMTALPFVFYRIITPITAVDGPRTSFDELGFTCETPTDDVSILSLPLKDTRRGISVLVLFQPGVRGEIDWTAHYQAPHVWDPLRLEGVDSLTWSARNLDGRDLPVPVTHLALKVVFPVGASGIGLRERDERGTVHEELLSSGARCISWEDAEPWGARYQWDVVMSPGYS